MGTVGTTKPTNLSMKFLVVLALASLALAEPEADPALLYSNVGYHGLYQPSVYGVYPYNAFPYNNFYGLRTFSALPHISKREAEAEPEAEADPALVYTAGINTPLVYNSAVHTPLVYNTAVQTPHVYKTVQQPQIYTSAVHTPLVYNTSLHTPVVNTAVQTPVVNTVYKTAVVNTVYKTPVVYNTPLTTLTKAFPSLKTFTAPVVSHVAKREAEADPALVYNTAVHHTPLVYNTAVQTPLVYNSAVQTPLVYKTAVQTPVAVHSPLLKTMDNAVVPTAAGYIHSSHVGVCTNNLGIRVPC